MKLFFILTLTKDHGCKWPWSRLDLHRDRIWKPPCALYTKYAPALGDALHPGVPSALRKILFSSEEANLPKGEFTLGCNEYVWSRTKRSSSSIPPPNLVLCPTRPLVSSPSSRHTLTQHGLLSSTQMPEQTRPSSKQFSTHRRSCHSCTKSLSLLIHNRAASRGNCYFMSCHQLSLSLSSGQFLHYTVCAQITFWCSFVESDNCVLYCCCFSRRNDYSFPRNTLRSFAISMCSCYI